MAHGYAALPTQLKATNANFHAVLIVRHGKLVFAQYFAGYDEPWGKCGSCREHDARADRAQQRGQFYVHRATARAGCNPYLS
jgi:hypothetical protein